MSPVSSVGDRRGARLGDLADERQRQVHVLGPDQPQLSAASSERACSRVCCSAAIAARAASVELDGGEQTQMVAISVRRLDLESRA